MSRTDFGGLLMRFAVPALLALLVAPSAFAADPFVVRTVEVTDRKAVVATVEPAHQLIARARIGGTIASLTIKEGDTVAAGAQIDGYDEPSSQAHDRRHDDPQ